MDAILAESHRQDMMGLLPMFRALAPQLLGKTEMCGGNGRQRKAELCFVCKLKLRKEAQAFFGRGFNGLLDMQS